MAALTTLALVLAGVGTGMSAVGQVKAGNAAKRAGKAQQDASNSQADLSDYNAQVATLQAQDAIQRGTEQEGRFRTQVKGMVGSQRAGAAGQGVDVNYGSAVDVQADTAFLGELDALTIRTNATREAWGYTVQAENFTRQGQIDRKAGVMQAAAGSAASTAARWGAAGTIVGGTSSLLMQRYGMGKK